MIRQLKSTLTEAVAFRIIGILLILSGVLLNRWSVGKMLAPDENITSVKLVAVIFTGQGCLLLAGLWLLLRTPHRNSPLMVRGLLMLVCTTTTVFGGYGTCRSLGWIQPHIKELSELGEWLFAGTAPALGRAHIKRLSTELARVESKPGKEDKTVDLHRELSDQLCVTGGSRRQLTTMSQRFA